MEGEKKVDAAGDEPGISTADALKKLGDLVNDDEADPVEQDAGETTEHGAGEETGNDDDAQEQAADDGETVESDEPSKPDKVQQRIDKLTAKAKTAEEKAEAAAAERDALKKQLGDSSLKAAEQAGIPAEWLGDGAKTVSEYQSLKSTIEFIEQHVDNPDGYVDESEPARNLPQAQLKAALRKANLKMMELAPEYGRVSKTAAKQFMDDARLGREIRQARAKKAATAATAVRKAGQTMPTPSRSSAKPGPVTPPSRTMDSTEFQRDGGTQAAAIKQISKLVPV